MKMNIQVQRAAEALDQRHGTGLARRLTSGVRQPGLLQHVPGDSPVDDPQHLTHRRRARAAAAAECAGEQDKYWEFHHAQYARQAEWATETAATVLPRIARDTGLDSAAFDRCFAGRAALERVLSDLYDAQGIVERTPSFVILTGDGTGSVSGGMPADGFIKFLGDLIKGQEPAPVK